MNNSKKNTEAQHAQSSYEMLEQTLESTAQLLNQYSFSWMVIGGAAMVLYGLENAPVDDIDIILPSRSAAFLCDQFALTNHADVRSSRFRSDYLLRPELGPVTVEILGGFQVSAKQGWIDISFCETQAFYAGKQKVFLPTKEALSLIFNLCGREKDIRRVALISG